MCIRDRPVPVSSTTSVRTPLSYSVIKETPPSSVNLTAFDSKLFPICIIRSLSVNTMASCPVFTDKDNPDVYKRQAEETSLLWPCLLWHSWKSFAFSLILLYNSWNFCGQLFLSVIQFLHGILYIPKELFLFCKKTADRIRICLLYTSSKQKNNGTRRRFESIGKNHGFSPCCEYHTRNYECILVLLRGNAQDRKSVV